MQEIINELAKDEYRKICFSIAKDDEFYYHCYSRLIESKKTLEAYRKGYLIKFFWSYCGNEFKWFNSDWNKNKRLPAYEPDTKEEFNPNVQRLERYLHTFLDENEKYIKKIVVIYIREGSVHAAFKASGIRPETIYKCINYVINSYSSDSTRVAN